MSENQVEFEKRIVASWRQIQEYSHSIVHLQELNTIIEAALLEFPRGKLSIYSIDTETLLHIRMWFDKWFGVEENT